MSFFNILADAAEDNFKLGAGAIDVAHRTHNGLVDAVGIGKHLPTPIKNLTDGVYDTNKKIVLGTGNKTAKVLRTIGGALGGAQGSSHQLPGNENNRPVDKTQGAYSDDKEDGPAPESTHPLHHAGTYPDSYDPRDHPFEYDPHYVLSHSVDLRHLCPPVYNQGHSGSCTAQAVAGAFEFSVKQQNLPYFSPSRLFIWYNGRAKSGSHDAVKKNVGISLRDAIQSVAPNSHGVCSEEDWSYEIGEYDEKTRYFKNNAKAARKPPVLATKHAHDHTAVTYKKFTVKEQYMLSKQLMQCLDKGTPFVFAMVHCGILKEDIVRATGRGVKEPTAKHLEGAHRHAMMAVGYIKEERVFIVRNSWGADWGDNGYFYLPVSLLYLCYDFWSIKVDVPGRK